MQGILGELVADVLGRRVNFCLLHALSVFKYTSVFTGNVQFAYSLFQNKYTTSIQHHKLTFVPTSSGYVTPCIVLIGRSVIQLRAVIFSNACLVPPLELGHLHYS